MKKINPSERVTIALTLLILAPLGGAAAEQNTDVCKAADGALSKGQLEEALSLYQTCRQQNAPRLETQTSESSTRGSGSLKMGSRLTNRPWRWILATRR